MSSVLVHFRRASKFCTFCLRGIGGGGTCGHRLACSELDVDDLVVISAIIDLLGVGGMRHVAVPVEMNGPGAGLPLSHLVVENDGRLRRIGLSNPVHDLVIIGGVVDGTLRPGVSPVSTRLQSLGIDTLGLGLNESDTGEVVVSLEGDGIDAGHESQSSNKFHFY